MKINGGINTIQIGNMVIHDTSIYKLKYTVQIKSFSPLKIRPWLRQLSQPVTDERITCVNSDMLL